MGMEYYVVTMSVVAHHFNFHWKMKGRRWAPRTCTKSWSTPVLQMLLNDDETLAIPNSPYPSSSSIRREYRVPPVLDFKILMSTWTASNLYCQSPISSPRNWLQEVPITVFSTILAPLWISITSLRFWEVLAGNLHKNLRFFSIGPPLKTCGLPKRWMFLTVCICWWNFASFHPWEVVVLGHSFTSLVK